MWRALTKWFSKKLSKPMVTKAAQTALPNIIAEQVHLHWHVNDIAQVPGHFTWNAKLNSANSPILQQTFLKTADSLIDDEQLLERSRTQWQFGDWESLAALSREEIEGHPERAKLALLAAAGHQQVGDMSAARDFVQLARDWGCDKRLISRVLVSGVYNTLAKAAAIEGRHDKALGLFEQSVKVGMPGSEGRLLINARTNEQLAQLGFATGIK